MIVHHKESFVLLCQSDSNDVPCRENRFLLLDLTVDPKFAIVAMPPARVKPIPRQLAHCIASFDANRYLLKVPRTQDLHFTVQPTFYRCNCQWVNIEHWVWHCDNLVSLDQRRLLKLLLIVSDRFLEGLQIVGKLILLRLWQLLTTVYSLGRLKRHDVMKNMRWIEQARMANLFLAWETVVAVPVAWFLSHTLSVEMWVHTLTQVLRYLKTAHKVKGWAGKSVYKLVFNFVFPWVQQYH